MRAPFIAELPNLTW